ncbi:hypothetical protein TNCV_4367401 [Trichonephila clavipes]|nr:hypothetical protein TNCV_4367401 [Trichonephila clavipes]
MSSFLVLCEGDTRNRWRDGQVCPDVRQGTMAPWARRLGGEEKKEDKERFRERERTEGGGETKKSGENGEETRGEDRRDGERKGLSPGLEWKDDERRWRNQGYTSEIMDEILTTARDLELEANDDDIEELIMGHEDELTIEELQEILNEEHQET